MLHVLTGSLIAGAVAVAALPSAEPRGAQVWHFPHGHTQTITATAEDGSFATVGGETTPGDFVRRNPDGTWFSTVTVRGDATVHLAGLPFDFVGEGRVAVNGLGDPDDPEDPLGGFVWSFLRQTAMMDSIVADPFGGLWHLTVRIVLRDGEFRMEFVEFVPL